MENGHTPVQSLCPTQLLFFFSIKKKFIQLIGSEQVNEIKQNRRSSLGPAMVHVENKTGVVECTSLFIGVATVVSALDSVC